MTHLITHHTATHSFIHRTTATLLSISVLCKCACACIHYRARSLLFSWNAEHHLMMHMLLWLHAKGLRKVSESEGSEPTRHSLHHESASRPYTVRCWLTREVWPRTIRTLCEWYIGNGLMINIQRNRCPKANQITIPNKERIVTKNSMCVWLYRMESIWWEERFSSRNITQIYWKSVEM